jgi:catalase
MGHIRIERRKGEESLREEKGVIPGPGPRVEGVGGSADPMLDVRADVYLITGRERRSAESDKA